ncbi:MAG: c-type cytochrome [Gemmataceae bacterium]|nr:c-type cytochrome [Gemmataceae bacterium]
MKSFLVVLVLVFPSMVCAGSSNSLLDVSPDSKWLLVANTDNGTVTVVDTATKKAVREIKVGEKPEGVSWIGNGPRAVVTLYRDNAVVFFDASTGTVDKKLPVAHEPYGVVADPQGKTAWVTHEYPGIVSELDLDKQSVVREIKVGSHVRGIAHSPTENRVYVSEFYTGILRAVDLASGKVVDSWNGHDTDNLCRHVLLHPNRPKAYLAHIRSRVTVNHGAGSIFPQLSIIDLRPGDDKRRTSFRMDTFNGIYVTCNPWEAAMTPDGKKMFVIYAGTNDMNVCTVIDDDYNEIDRDSLPTQIGKNPRAVRVSPDGQTLYIYNAMDFAVTAYAVNSMKKLAMIPVCEPPKTPEWVRGKILFNSSLSPMTSRRWIACSSCHPDGHHDARVWQQPEGKRETTALLGLAHTQPLHWSADRDETQDFEFTIRSQLMQGIGLMKGPLKAKKGFEPVELDVVTSGKSKDLDALAIYCNAFDFPLSPHVAAPGKLSEAAQRGKALFFRKELGCATCHSGPYFTDSTLQKPYKLHDVGTGNDDPTEKMGAKYDTPTLLGIYRTAPYLHHGKAKTLHEVLTAFNKGDRHGKTSQLAKAEIDDLVEFLKALPYETPPAVTENTSPFRLK